MALKSQKAKLWITLWELYTTFPGSESMACNQSEQGNVGDPNLSSRIEVSMNKCNNEKVETRIRKSERLQYL